MKLQMSVILSGTSNQIQKWENKWPKIILSVKLLNVRAVKFKGFTISFFWWINLLRFLSSVLRLALFSYYEATVAVVIFSHDQ